MGKLQKDGSISGNTHLQAHALSGTDHTGTLALTQLADGLITEAKLDTSTQNKINAQGNITAGLAVNRPTAPSADGATYFATDTNILYIGVTSAWVGVELS